MKGFTVEYGIADLGSECVEIGAEKGLPPLSRLPIIYTDNSYLPSDGETVAIKRFKDGSYELAPVSFFRLS